MSTYQILLLRFMRMKEEMPHLNHRGHEPSYSEGSIGEPQPGSLGARMKEKQKQRAEREFYRPVEKSL